MHKIGHISCQKHETLSDGMLDQVSHQESLRNVMGLPQPLKKDPEGVINAEHKFAKQKAERLHLWKPTKEDLDAIRDLIGERAVAK